MRYRLAVLTLFAVLPGMKAEAAPVPAPSAILDIGPPPKGETAEAYCKRQIKGHTFHAVLSRVWCDPKVRDLPSVARFEDARPWLAENLRITEEEGGRRLRFTFRAGAATDQAAILNAFLRFNLQGRGRSIKFHEKSLRFYENGILELEKHIESGQHRESVDSYRKAIDGLRSIHIPACRAEIARLKQVTVIRWAK